MFILMINLTLRLTLGRTLTLGLTDTCKTTLHWDLIMLLKKLILGLRTNACEKLYTGTDSCWWQTWLTNAYERWETLHQILPLLVSNLTLRLAHGSDKPYDWHLLMAAVNLLLTLIYGGEEPYARTYSCLWEILHRDRLKVARNLTKSYSWWRETLHWNLLMFVTNLSRKLTHVDEKPYTWTFWC